MCGNIEEWTRSLKEPHPYGPANGPEDVESSAARVVRGGSFLNFESFVRGADRDHFAPDSRGVNIGFRVVVSDRTNA